MFLIMNINLWGTLELAMVEFEHWEVLIFMCGVCVCVCVSVDAGSRAQCVIWCFCCY